MVIDKYHLCSSLVIDPPLQSLPQALYSAEHHKQLRCNHLLSITMDLTELVIGRVFAKTSTAAV
jgi:hypothetical protein